MLLKVNTISECSMLYNSLHLMYVYNFRVAFPIPLNICFQIAFTFCKYGTLQSFGKKELDSI